MNSDFENILREYKEGKISLTKAAEKLNTSRYKLKKLLENKNIKVDSTYKKRTHFFNENFFKNIDTEEKAYWLGFISADGHVGKYQISIILSYKDKDHLFKLCNDIDGSSLKVKEGYVNTSYGNIKTVRITINSIQMVKDLRKLGLQSNKTYNLSFPNIPDNFTRHYIRGYFDGDGCISLSGGTYKKPYVIFLGNKSMMCSIKNHMNISKKVSILKREDKKEMYHFRIGKHKDVINIYDYFYTDSTVYLDRKKDKFEKLIGASETIIAQPKA